MLRLYLKKRSRRRLSESVAARAGLTAACWVDSSVANSLHTASLIPTTNILL